MENELELRFDDEAGIYLPQVVAEENRRKANEFERVANEEKRIANEEERVANEEYRKTTMEQLEQKANNLVDELNASSKRISFIKRYKEIYTTTTENESTFNMPNQYTETSMLDVRVNGWVLNETEYTIDITNLTVTLVKPLDVGAVVEIVATRLTTAHVEDYESLFYDDSELMARLTEIETELGNISNVLDLINGESVV